MVDRAIVGRIDHILADEDQFAARGKVVNGATVITGIDYRGGVFSQAPQVFGDREVGIDRFGVFKKGSQGRRCHRFTRMQQLLNGLKDGGVKRIVEVLGTQEIRGPVHGVVVDQDGTNKRLFRLDIVRNVAETRGLIGMCGRMQLVGREESMLCHAPVVDGVGRGVV